MTISGISEKVVVLVGATGGLGQAIARRLQAEHARVMLVGRNADILKAMTGKEAHYTIADVTSLEALQSVLHNTLMQFGRVDLVINATGFDVRKPLSLHTDEDVNRSIAINLTGAINMTRTFMETMTAQDSGLIVHLGGFGDGRLAFPFYSVNVATRAGLHAFIESTNRELRALGHRVRLMYFGPTSTDTEAERPFHALWDEMGVRLVAVDETVDALISAIQTARPVHVMGLGARALTLLNAISPCVADAVILKRYSTILRNHLA